MTTMPMDFSKYNILGQFQVPDIMGSAGTPPYIGIPNPTGSMGGGASPFGLNLDTAKLALSGLGTIGNIWAASKAMGLARDQFNFTKDITNTNLNNQIQSYNTSLADRSRSRAFVEGQPSSVADDYVRLNSLKR